jgi:hypothetical protein
MAGLADSLQVVLEESSDGDEFLKWLEPALDSLQKEGERSEAERRAQFIQVLGVNEAEFNTDPMAYGIGEFVRYVDNLPDEDRWPALADADEQDSWTQRCYWPWVQGDDTYVSWRRRVGLEWVTDEQQALLGGGWRQAVTGLLDKNWPQWWYPVTSEEDLAGWLPDWLPVLTGEAPPPPENPITTLAWVRPAEAQELLGQGWQKLIVFKLDQVWPDWRQQTDSAVLDGWLRDWTPALQGARDLAWVPAQMQERLATLGATWPGQLRDSLDKIWAEWRVETDTAVLAGWLPDWIHQLFPQFASPPGEPVPPGDGEPSAPDNAQAELVLKNVVEPCMNELTQKLPALAESLGLTLEELTAEMAQLPSEFFEQAILESL